MRIKEDIPILGSVTVNFLDLSNRIYTLYESTEEIKRQKRSPHLGLISHAFRSSSHCRFDYLILQCVISEIIENTFKGTTNAQGSIKVNGKSYLGNDIIKSWILLSNFGHCKNTIGDEKTIQYSNAIKNGVTGRMEATFNCGEVQAQCSVNDDKDDFREFGPAWRSGNQCTTSLAPFCGDGVVDAGEQCDL